MSKRVYTHIGDMDGLLCGALLLDQAFPTSGLSYDVKPIGYDQLDEIQPPCIVCDINLPADHPVWMDEESMVFDHHPSSAPDRPRQGKPGRLCIYEWAHDACAASLVWRWVGSSHDWEWLVEVVDAGDLWKVAKVESFENARALTALFDAVGYKEMSDLVLLLKSGILQKPYSDISKALLGRRRERQHNSAAATLVDFGAWTACLVSDGSASEVASGMAERYGKPCAAIVVGQMAEGKGVTVQVRGPHAKQLAEMYGGGGHEKAAGFMISQNQAHEAFSVMMTRLFSRIPTVRGDIWESEE